MVCVIKSDTVDLKPEHQALLERVRYSLWLHILKFCNELQLLLAVSYLQLTETLTLQTSSMEVFICNVLLMKRHNCHRLVFRAARIVEVFIYAFDNKKCN